MPEVHSAILSDYILRKSRAGLLTKWTVVLLSSKDSGSKPAQKLIYPANLFLRTNRTNYNGSTKYTIQQLLSPRDEQTGLSKEAIKEAFLETKEIWKNAPVEDRSLNEPTYASGPLLRKRRPLQEGLLILYPLDSNHAELHYKEDIPTMALGISFHSDKFDPGDGVEYDVNRIYIKELGDEDND